MFDPYARRVAAEDRIERLGRDFDAGSSALRGTTFRRMAARLRLPFAAPELQLARGALPRPVSPFHLGAAAPASLAHRPEATEAVGYDDAATAA